MELIKYGRNVIVREVGGDHRGTHTFLLISDAHWDNPYCLREQLKCDLDKARHKGARILINGDFFCLMQGKYDPRRSKKNIRPEHNKANYLDAVIEDAVEWWSPYADLIDFIGYGNHETAIIKNCETDPLQRFVDLLNFKNKTNVQVGGYGGWYIVKFNRTSGGTLGTRGSYKIKYHHGWGGGGPVTKGTIQNNRLQTYVEGADMFWMGHVHEDYELTYTLETLNQRFEVKHKEILHVRTPSYKEEYEDGYGDFHVERGRPPKPVGGRWLDLHLDIKSSGRCKIIGRTYKT